MYDPERDRSLPREIPTGRFIAHPRNYRPQGFQFGDSSEEMSCTPERADPGETGWKDMEAGRIAKSIY